jgi:serine phosphatase RsbU (regulator of sigma subunit)
LLSPAARAGSRVARYPPGALVVREGDAGGSAFILLGGRCEVTVHGHRLNVISPGELFGEIACLEGGTRTATVRADVECDVLELDGPTLRAALADSPAMLDRLLRALARRLRDISGREVAVRDEQHQLRRVLETLQPSLSRFADHSALAVEVRWEPLSVTSGDYYDVLELRPDCYLFALGDVMGHGAATTPILGMVRGQLHEAAAPGRHPHTLLAHLHRHMQRHGHPDVFMTLALLQLDLASRTAEYALAGPPSPLLWRDGQSRPIARQFGWTLGYPFGTQPFWSETLALAPGDVLLFYTDGLSDAARGPDPDKDALGTDGLCRLLTDVCGERTAGIADAIVDRVQQYRGAWPAEDDATAMAVRLR